MKKKILYLLPFAILLILFVPIKFQYRDGGTVDYRALMYRVIKWNKLNNDGTYYQANDVIIFPNNFHRKVFSYSSIPIKTTCNEILVCC